MLAEIAEGLNPENEPPEIGDFGFHYPYASVALAVSVLKASNYQCWPDAGGLMDQDSYMVSDMMRYLSIERRLDWENKAQDASDKATKDNPDIVTEDIFR